MFNDLIGLRYGWHCRPNDGTGKTDCFQLVCEARRRLGMSDYAPRFEWVYSVYDEFSLPPRQILRWLFFDLSWSKSWGTWNPDGSRNFIHRPRRLCCAFAARRD
jgi:hypothetical protein